MVINVLRSGSNRGKMLTVEDGYLICPVCRQNRKLQPVTPETRATRLPVYCRRCKHRIVVDIENGLCFESPCP